MKTLGPIVLEPYINMYERGRWTHPQPFKAQGILSRPVPPLNIPDPKMLKTDLKQTKLLRKTDQNQTYFNLLPDSSHKKWTKTRLIVDRARHPYILYLLTNYILGTHFASVLKLN